jgi:hypothetical protein
MPISADKIRELVARGENSTLDFKRDDYDWDDRASNAELAKDVMAMANVLLPADEPAYILIGVDNMGNIVGVPPANHLDDAVLHQKVQGLLNRTPLFSYAPVEVDGMSVGVFEIGPGGRPYFALRDQNTLRRHVAFYRNGSATDIASPTMIQEWGREDDPAARRLREMELRKHEADAAIRGLARHLSFDIQNDVKIRVLVENIGRSGFTIVRFDWRVEWNDQFHEALAKAGAKLPADYVPPADQLALPPDTFIPAGARKELTFEWKRSDALAHIAAASISVPGFSGSWATYYFDVLCRGELAGEAVVSCKAPVN